MLDRSLSEVLSTTKAHLKRLESLGIKTILDFLLYFPRDYEDASSYTKISDLQFGEKIAFKGHLTSVFNMKTKYGKSITRGVLADDTGILEVMWFNQPHLKRILFKNMEVVLTGKVKLSQGKPLLQSPNYEIVKRGVEQLHSGRVVPVYPLTEGLNNKWFREKLKPVLDAYFRYLEDPLPSGVVENNALMNYQEAVYNVHFPENLETLEKARYRLAFEELFFLQINNLRKKWEWQKIAEKDSKEILDSNSEIVINKCIQDLPFDLTGAQNRVLQDIRNDLSRSFPMRRLVQGDVGSGKTVVAALAALAVVNSGYQVAVMAPTEILAKQHYQTFLKVLRQFSFNIQFIAGSTTKKQKEELYTQMKTGTVDIVIGTHALIQEGVGFKNLGLAIIDEQHRFGVKQRDVLKGYGSPHLLSMTATPIPRTLAITIFGDQDLSEIDEMPAGRQEIVTRVVPEKKRQDAYIWVEDQVKKGRQAFVICPLIDESDTLELKSVLQEYDHLNNDIFPDLKVALLHGKMKQEEKDQIMEDFKENKTQILVSTSVIEVGIDVPNATMMFIEGAERFGLSQLHQFRGRVGRGEHQSYCFLFTNSLSDSGKERMRSMEKYSSGFKLAEIDLELRGPGEIYGVRQSGIPDLRMASLTDVATLQKAKNAAELVMDKIKNLKC